MSSFKSEPFLWIHLAGIVTFPVFLGIVWFGLSVSDRLPILWLEILLMVGVGVIPIFLMQWSRPFEIFSLLVLAMKPDKITFQQRQILSLFKTPRQRILSAATAMAMVGILCALYQLPPLTAIASSVLTQSRFVGLLIASIAFAAANLFLQVPISVLGVLSIDEQQFAKIEPYPTEKIPQDFTLAGFRVDKIIPIEPVSTQK
ncbi:low-complexity tail membrane protein [Tumidithrix helvetica PCC 7403]|uniref:low-complexity tail membrane protein n=1 Tax=Tumidithrix helvetica TaxID=3457545 RepID=UPI003C81995D